tara:strand:- start:126 stop:1646 length:1521 start_codon:yes stop_codon:yes gene_type:complete
MLDSERQKTALQQSGQIFSAFEAKQPGIAIGLMDQQIAAKENAGDTAGADFLKKWRDVAKETPEATQIFFGNMLTQIPGGDKVIESAIKLGAERRAAGLAKPTLDKAVADAKGALADAEKKVLETAGTPARLLAEEDYRAAQTALQRAQAAASEGTEARAITKFAPELREIIAKADAAVADAEKKVLETAGTPAQLAAELDLRVAQVAKERALTAASVGGEARAAEKAPSELIAAKAKADKDVADAKTAQATAKNADETAAANAKRATAEAEKARIEAQFEEQKIKLGFRKTEQDIIIAKENARIAALNAAQAKETNTLKRLELQQKIDEATEKRNTTDREQKATFISQVADIDNFLNTAERIKQTPKNIIESATGPIASRLPTTSADVADFESLVETLGSQVFIAQIPKIKGTGALSEKEGDKLQASVQNLSLKQSPARLIENVNEAVRLMEKARINLAVRAGIPAMPLDVPARQEVFVSLPNGTRIKFPDQAAADAYKRIAGIQ